MDSIRHGYGKETCCKNVGRHQGACGLGDGSLHRSQWRLSQTVSTLIRQQSPPTPPPNTHTDTASPPSSTPTHLT
jgi:hypothetical protein